MSLETGTTRPVGRHNRRRGSQVVEAALMFLPFFALVFLTIDTAWGLFVKATIQHAVHEGVRFGITGQPGDAIKAKVNSESLNLLALAGSTVTVTYLDATTLASAPNNPGNLVQITATYPFSPLAPLFRSGATINLTATSADVIEGFPGTTPPSP
jgi:Flp pilus assembly protein TadG